MKPLVAFSKRQLAGKGRCVACAAQSTASNLAQQAEGRQKRGREMAAGLALDECCRGEQDDDDPYVRELLRGVNEARAEQARRRTCSAEAAALDERNPGHQMLQRLGWSTGSGLGARGDGELLPVSHALAAQHDRRGLGREEADDLIRDAGTGDVETREEPDDAVAPGEPAGRPAPRELIEAWERASREGAACGDAAI
eukprot:7065873-Prymnesium_polylepis.2